MVEGRDQAAKESPAGSQGQVLSAQTPKMQPARDKVVPHRLLMESTPGLIKLKRKRLVRNIQMCIL